MASTEPLSRVSQYAPDKAQPTLPLQPARGRQVQRGQSSTQSLQSVSDPQRDMGHKHSKPLQPSANAKAGARNTANIRSANTSAPSTAHKQKRDSSPTPVSICQSPTWSPRGSMAVRRQSDKDRREEERRLRKEADEARKLLREEEKQRHAAEKRERETRSNGQEGQKPRLRHTGRRLTKEPPPAAMDTQRMSAALRADRSLAEEPVARRRRSSSLSGILQLVTRGRSRSRIRNGNASDGESSSMSDASTKSKASFIGGVKLTQARRDVGQRPNIAADSIAPGNGPFVSVLEPQKDNLTGLAGDDVINAVINTQTKPTTGAKAVESTPLSRSHHVPQAGAEVNANMGRRRSQKLDQQIKSEQKPHKAGEQAPRAEIQSNNDASLNRMQNLVTPLRSALKGGRQTAATSRAMSLPTFGSSSVPPAAPPPAKQASSTNYVLRARMHAQSHSLAGWQDEMLVQNANTTATTQAPYGPQMPPTPDTSIDNLVRPLKDCDEQQQPSLYPLATKPSQELDEPPLVEAGQVVWKQPIKANKNAAAERIEQHKEHAAAMSDIYKLPSQNKLRRTSESEALKPGQPRTTQIFENTVTSPQQTPGAEAENILPISPTQEKLDQGLRRQPAVMSWKAEKSSKTKLTSRAKSPTTPILSPEVALSPLDHPSLQALKADVITSTDSPKHSRQSSNSSLIFRPLSIIPTPSPAPTDQPVSSIVPTPVASPLPARRHSTPVEVTTLPTQAIITDSIKSSSADSSKSLASSPLAIPAFPFPDRHESLKKPSKNNVTSHAAPPEKLIPAGKVSFYTPSETLRYLAVATGYDKYRRPYSTPSSQSPKLPFAGTTNAADLATSDNEVDPDLPVHVAQLAMSKTSSAKPNKATNKNGSSLSSPHTSPSIPPKSPRRQSYDGSGGSLASPQQGPRVHKVPSNFPVDPNVNISSGDGSYIYLPFSTANSCSTLELSESGSAEGARRVINKERKMPKGFVMRNADGKVADVTAKLFVLCCGCGKWHDVPSAVYAEMARGRRGTDVGRDGVAEATVRSRGGERGDVKEEGMGFENQRDREAKVGAPMVGKDGQGYRGQGEGKDDVGTWKETGVVATVPCCWCKHEMSTMCCEGWSTLCYKNAQHHSLEGRVEKPAQGAVMVR